MTDETKMSTKYESYVHTGNSGFGIGVEVVCGDNGYEGQYLTTSLHAFGLPHETKMWLDDNIIDAFEYILAKARTQRAYFELLNAANCSKAVPPHSHDADVGRCVDREYDGVNTDNHPGLSIE